MPDNLRVVHVVYDEILNPVIDSQVVAPLVAVAGSGLDVELVAYVSPRALVSPKLRRLLQARQAELRARIPGTVTFLTYAPRNSFKRLSTRKLIRRQKRALAAGQPVVVHARGPHAAALAIPVSLRYATAAVIFDSRGLAAAEYRYTADTSLKKDQEEIEVGSKKHAEIERASAIGADLVFTVSQALADHFTNEYKVPAEKVRVMRTLVDTTHFRPDPEARAEVRRQMEIPPNARVIAYSGGAAAWQLPFATAQLVAAQHARDPSVIYLVLSNDALSFRLAAEGAGLPGEAIRVINVSHEQVPRYLAAADAGVLLREDSLVNRVSSPVVLAEYLAVGLPVIISGCIGDTAARVAADGLGVVVDPLSPASYEGVLAALDALGNPAAIARRCHEFAIKQHGRETVTTRAIQEYRALARIVVGGTRRR